ncbi:MAG: alpha/beta fold hydrolase [Solobacterium sp.]|nr:alpha/beta fold hydrolase [Solobacterium sp.]MCH4223168.1 alpha/beta fold hydrolase [Solobacterium sp.]
MNKSLRILTSCMLVLCTGCTGAVTASVSDFEVSASAEATAEPDETEHLTVRPADTQESIQEVASMHEDLNYREFWINSTIPVLEVSSKDADKNTPIVFFLHGITGCKEQETYILSRLAEAGYRAVSFDLPGHGERQDGAYVFMDVVEQGMKDLNSILDYYTAEHYDTAHYALGGFSTGAIIAYAYGMSGSYHPSVLIPVSGVADWNDLEQSSLLDRCYEHGVQVEMTSTKEAEQQEILEDNPYRSLSSLASTPVIICHGTEDTTFDCEIAQRTADDLIALGNKNVSLNLYPVAHEFPAQFFNVMIQNLHIYLPVTEPQR